MVEFLRKLAVCFIKKQPFKIRLLNVTIWIGVVQKFIVAVSEHRLFGFLVIPYLVEDGVDNKYLTITKRVHVHDLADPNFTFSAVQTQLVRLTEKYADENIAKK